MARRQTIPRPEDLLTVNEACDLLKISRNTLYRWVSLGHLDLYKIGGSTRLDRAQIEKSLIRRVVAS